MRKVTAYPDLYIESSTDREGYYIEAKYIPGNPLRKLDDLKGDARKCLQDATKEALTIIDPEVYWRIGLVFVVDATSEVDAYKYEFEEFEMAFRSLGDLGADFSAVHSVRKEVWFPPSEFTCPGIAILGTLNHKNDK